MPNDKEEREHEKRFRALLEKLQLADATNTVATLTPWEVHYLLRQIDGPRYP
jgi:hypothetical protein